MNFDISIPKTDKERKARNAACVLSIVRGSVPYMRSMGVRADIDAAAIGGAQRLMGYAAQDVETHVKGAKVTRGNVIVSADGQTTVRLVLGDK